MNQICDFYVKIMKIDEWATFKVSLILSRSCFVVTRLVCISFISLQWNIHFLYNDLEQIPCISRVFWSSKFCLFYGKKNQSRFFFIWKKGNNLIFIYRVKYILSLLDHLTSNREKKYVNNNCHQGKVFTKLNKLPQYSPKRTLNHTDKHKW